MPMEGEGDREGGGRHNCITLTGCFADSKVASMAAIWLALSWRVRCAESLCHSHIITVHTTL